MRRRGFGRSRAATALAAILGTACGRGGAPVGLSTTKTAPTLAKAYEGLPVETWAARLSDPDPAVRLEATAAMSALGASGEEGRVGLLALLGDLAPSVRFGALDALSRIAAPEEATIAASLTLLDDRDDGVRRHAKAVAIRWGAMSIPSLRPRIGSKDERVRRDALEVLGSMRGEGQPLVPELVALLAGDDLAAEDDAAQALARMGRAGVPALAHALGDPRSDTAVLAASALEHLGADAVGALDQLVLALHRGGSLRRAAAAALVAVGEPARPALEAAAKDADEAVRDAATEALELLPKR